MDIKILFDSVALDNKFLTGWGVSYLIDDKILFDTGEDPYFLLSNMACMNAKIDDITTVIISHDHWDHTGGLEGILKTKKGINIYICHDFNQKFKDQIKNLHGIAIETDKITEIQKNIFTTGEMFGIYDGGYMPEQALIVKTENGITVITGCAHPGILEILEKVQENFPQEKLYFVLGGFHLKDTKRGEIEGIVARFKDMGVEKVGASHCSGKKAEEIFKEGYGENFIPIRIGQTLKI
ncbi:MAG: MBL fold metallo-hydrolase [Candidatus Zapsychrus exili]|nr:MBL fold metallo-hydrolase [Candidatus Zapsychrus exili]